MAPVMIITGGSQGIGAAVARLAGARGYAVALTYQSNRRMADEIVTTITTGGGQADCHSGGDGGRGFDPRVVPRG